MPSRIATGPAGDPDRLKALILSQPALVEGGFRVLDVDLMAGPAGPIDIVGAGPSGSLAILAVARGDNDAALLRLLDQYLWATDQRDLLRRLYAGSGVAGDRPMRCLLLASSFTHAFLRRLALLAAPVTPLLARAIPGGGERGVLIEPAAPIFGIALPGAEEADGSTEPVIASPSAESPEAAEERPVSVAAEIVAEAEAGRDDPLEAFLLETNAADPFETLTAEEMEEFERFDRHRRERGGDRP